MNPHSSSPVKTGVLLVNLGTPDAPTPAAVRKYLAEFLSDRRVIDYPRWLWLPILHGIILRIRPRRSARAYQQIWGDKGSPLLAFTDALCNKIKETLVPSCEDTLLVNFAMRYGNPSIKSALEAMRANGMRRLLLVPLYPQYSATTTATAFDEVAKVLASWPFIPEFRMVQSYWNEPSHISALAQSVRDHWKIHGRTDKLLFSFHGIPTRYLRNGDPYFCQCQGTAFRVAQALNLTTHEWQLSFQSRVGREPWLQPYTEETLRGFPEQGVKSVQVICPGFAVDCLETLEEIDMQNHEIFIRSGGERFEYIAALNDNNAQVQSLVAVIQKHAANWPPFVNAENIQALADEQEVAQQNFQRVKDIYPRDFP